MLRFVERTLSALDQRLILLAPPGPVPSFFQRVQVDRPRHSALVREMQQLRGHIYLNDGAVRLEQLSPDRRHQTPEDSHSWHLLTVDREQRVTGCAWYLQHEEDVTARQLRVRRCPLARMKEWRDLLWDSVEGELDRARREFLRYAEVGGWAVARDAGCRAEGLVIALAGYSLGQICGGCLGITTATVRHCSSSILRRLGGAPLEAAGVAVPSYYDPMYSCEMEILRFDSRQPHPKYAPLVARLRETMAHVRVIALPEQRKRPDRRATTRSSAPWIDLQTPAFAQ